MRLNRNRWKGFRYGREVIFFKYSNGIKWNSEKLEDHFNLRIYFIANKKLHKNEEKKLMKSLYR